MVTERKRGSSREIISCWLPPVAYMALIFFMSSRPVPELILPEIWNIDKVIHFIEYGILGILWFRALNTNMDEAREITIAAFTITFIYGISDEIHQYFVPERSASIFDAIADGAGGWAGVWLYGRIALKSSLGGGKNAFGKHHDG